MQLVLEPASIWKYIKYSLLIFHFFMHSRKQTAQHIELDEKKTTWNRMEEKVYILKQLLVTVSKFFFDARHVKKGFSSIKFVQIKVEKKKC